MKTNEHNEEKKSLLDTLEKGGVSGGFCVPENYFEMLSEKISDKVQSIPNLSSVPKETAFEVPDGYFVHLEYAIRENISSETTSIPAQIERWYRRPKLVLAYASVLVIIVFSSVYLLTITNAVTEKDILFNDIYNSDYVNELDESSLAAMLDESSSPSSTQLEDYMIDNNIDISTLTDEL
jgi:hypothetical protein